MSFVCELDYTSCVVTVLFLSAVHEGNSIVRRFLALILWYTVFLFNYIALAVTAHVKYDFILHGC